MPNFSHLVSLSASLALALALAACGDDEPSPDAGDAGLSDVTSSDTGTPDTGSSDAGADTGVDAGVDSGPTAELRFIDLAPAPFRTEPRELSTNGRLALFEALGAGTLYLYEVDTATGTEVASLSFPERNQALALSDDGVIAANYGYPVEAAVWSAQQGWQILSSPFPAGCADSFTQELTDNAGAFGISADGTVVAGLAWDECEPRAARWVATSTSFEAEALAVLGMPSTAAGHATPPNRASVVSADGMVVAGWAENQAADRSPAIWNRDGTGFLLDPNDFDAPGEVLSINGDGSVVAGIWGGAGFRWSASGGRVDLGRLPDTLPFDFVYPNALALDGELIFGTNGNQAFVWTESDGMRTLASVLEGAGLALDEGVTLSNVLGASADGTVVLGSVVDYAVDPLGRTYAFILILPVSAYGL